MYKSSVLNNFLFYFQTKVIKLTWQLSLDFSFFAFINNCFSELSNCDTIWYVLRKTTKFNEESSVNALITKFKIGKIILLL